LVRELAGGRYELIAGERRARAAQRAGLEDVPVLVVETDERGSLERALVENVQRTDLNPIEEAAAYRQLIEDGGLTHEVVAERVGRNRVTVTSVLRLLDLPIPVQRLLIDGRLSAAHGRILLRLQGNPFQERLARRAADEGLSVRETEEQVRRYESIAGVSPPTGRTRAADEQSAVLTELQRRLADRLQTRVRIQMGKRKGKLVVDFVSVEELERITQLMLVDLSSERMVVRPE
jgi:ParB family chromosome partitioning protein